VLSQDNRVIACRPTNGWPLRVVLLYQSGINL